MYQEEETGSNQLEPMFLPNVRRDTVELQQTDMSPGKTLTVLQGVGSTVQVERPDVLTSGAVRSAEGGDGVSLSDYCAEKLQSFHEVAMSQLVDLNGVSTAVFLGDGELQIQIATGRASAE